MNFRLGSPASPGFPKQLEDIDQVVTYMKNMFTQSVTFALFGASSGGHLATLYAYSWDKINQNVKVAVNIVGPSDLTDPAYANHPERERLFNFVGPCLNTECPEQYVAASPVYHIDANSPKTIGFFGTLDFIIPPSQMFLLRDKLVEAGVISKFTMCPGGHWDDWSDENKNNTAVQITQFFIEHWQ
ncbi:uncharacterized protein LOC110855186 [Folsomia candida]|uniref:uncharacterized protein LOC110855186 n=1 Tax=Folsomia candida TaxID=158441 RepID=UPI000B9001CD|nr:uncharacterized protein LOC110855186 [Folsomia candida]XP_035711958.1 uncharacterized protein LOC110855186 [Folsomia candida]